MPRSPLLNPSSCAPDFQQHFINPHYKYFEHSCPTCPTIYNWMPCTRLENQIRIPTCNETNYARTDLIFWVCMALRNQLKLLRRLSLKYSLKLCCKVIRHPFQNSYHRSVFIHCSQFHNTANYGRSIILLKTHVVLVRVACGSNIRYCNL